MATPTWVESAIANTGGTLFPGDVCWAPFTVTPLLIIVGNRTASAAIIQTSPDGAAWTIQSYPSISVLRACAFSPTLNRAVVVGAGVAGWSDDGVTWNAATSLPEANDWTGLVWFSSASIFVAVSTNGTHRVMTSADGKSWTSQTAAAALTWRGVACSSGALLVASAGSVGASTQLIMTSTDGASWTLQTHASITVNSFTLGHSKVSYATALGLFGVAVIVAGVQKIMTSPDGATWTVQGVPSVTLDGLLWIPAQALWIVFCDSGHYLTSTDGITFTDNTYPGTFTHNGYGFGAWSSTLGLIFSPDTSSHDSIAVGTFIVPAVTKILPNNGTILGSTPVTITGVGFTGATQVTIGGISATSVVVVNDTTITAVTGAHASGRVDVIVVGKATGAHLYTYVIPKIQLPPIPVRSTLTQERS